MVMFETSIKIFKSQNVWKELIFLLFLIKLGSFEKTLIKDVSHMLIYKSFEMTEKFKNTQLVFFKILINKIWFLFVILVVNRSQFIRWTKNSIFICKCTFSFKIALLNAFIIIKLASNIFDFEFGIVGSDWL